ncbi:putative arginine and glutamate-rich protein [Tanacetum coccineum]
MAPTQKSYRAYTTSLSPKPEMAKTKPLFLGNLGGEEQARREREELDKMLEENRRRVEEAQRREALELQRKEEERHRELELIQRQKEEAARRKKLEDEEELIKLSSKVKFR